jgi:hypothetical protein
MAVRDRWEVDLRCPVCGVSGAAVVSEVDDPPVRSSGTLRVDRLPDGFRLRALGDTMRATKFECVRCGVLTQR